MNKYTLKINNGNSTKDEKIKEIPSVPFVIEVIEGAIGERYLVVQEDDNFDDNYNFKLIGLNNYNHGRIVLSKWSKGGILSAINTNTWTLKKSEIILS